MKFALSLSLSFLGLSWPKMQRANKRHAEIRTTMFRNKQTNVTGRWRGCGVGVGW